MLEGSPGRPRYLLGGPLSPAVEPHKLGCQDAGAGDIHCGKYSTPNAASANRPMALRRGVITNPTCSSVVPALQISAAL